MRSTPSKRKRGPRSLASRARRFGKLERKHGRNSNFVFTSSTTFVSPEVVAEPSAITSTSGEILLVSGSPAVSHVVSPAVSSVVLPSNGLVPIYSVAPACEHLTKLEQKWLR